MTHDEALRFTTDILLKHVERETIKPTDHIQNDLELDSLGVMEVIADIEDHFGIEIPSELLSKLATVDDVAKAIVTIKKA